MGLEEDVRGLSVLALALVSVAVIVGVGSIVLAEIQPVSFETSDLQSEAATPANPLPTNITVDQKTGDPDFEKITEGSTDVVFQDTSASTNTTLSESTDYNVYAGPGNIEILNVTATSDYNQSDGDKIFYDYSYEFSGDSTSILNTGIQAMQSFADFFTVIVVVGIASVLFLLLRVMRGSTRKIGA